MDELLVQYVDERSIVDWVNLFIIMGSQGRGTQRYVGGKKEKLVSFVFLMERCRMRLSFSRIRTVEGPDSNFDEFVKEHDKVLVEFYAPVCTLWTWEKVYTCKGPFAGESQEIAHYVSRTVTFFRKVESTTLLFSQSRYFSVF